MKACAAHAGSGSGSGSGFPPPAGPVYSSRFGEPEPGLVTTLVVAVEVSADVIAAGAAPGLACSVSAAAPATCGDAIEVPLIVFVRPPVQVDVMPEPGAKMSTHDP